jgi:type II secretory pathway component PulC
VEANELLTTADGLLIRLAFEPLIRQTGPVSLQLVQSTGYRLLGVVEGAPLWQLGLREGDVLTSVDGQTIVGRENELRSLWERRPVRAEIGYQREGRARTLSLRIRPGGAWRSSDVVTTVPPAPSTPLVPASEPGAGIRCVAADTAESLGRCEIELATLERLRADPASLAKQMRIIPNTRDGVEEGFKLYGIRSSSVVSQLGLQNGDVVLAVNSQRLTSLESTMLAFGGLAKLGSFTLTVERRGVPKQLTIAIVERLN